jgi:hypothetical protein
MQLKPDSPNTPLGMHWQINATKMGNGSPANLV